MSRVLVIDFETATTSATSACAIGAILIENDEIIQQYFSLIKPPSKTFQFTYIHGITWEQVKDAPTFKEMWEKDFGKLYESVDLVVAHNIGFDSRVLKATAEHHSITLPEKPTECTVKIARNQLEIKPAKLDNVCKTLKIPLQHHQALSDSLASAYIYLHAKTGEKPWLTGKPPERQYEFMVSESPDGPLDLNQDFSRPVPITALPKKSSANAPAKNFTHSISSLNSEQAKEKLAQLLAKIKL